MMDSLVAAVERIGDKVRVGAATIKAE